MTQLFHLQGWFEQNTEGLGTIYFAITDEGVLTTETDTPAAVAFPPRIRNPDTFSIRRMATFWPWGTQDSALAAYGTLEIDNYDGAFDFLIRSDLRDAPVVFQIIPAKMLAANNTVSTGLVVATAIIDDISSDNEDVIHIAFKDPLAKLDAPLLARYQPPYVDSSAANQMVPMTFGACRNVPPQLVAQDGLDGEGMPVYALHDTTLGNIAQTRDMGAILDVNASPPQVYPALNGSGIQLQSLPVGKLLVDCSNVGQQVIVSGAVDVLAGVGLLATAGYGGVTTWTPPAAPSGFTYGPSGTFTRFTFANGYVQDYCMDIQTKNLYGTGGATGAYAYVTTPFLQPGQTYRVYFTIDRVYGPSSGGVFGGFMVRTDLTNSTQGAVSGSAQGPYIIAPGDYVFEYTCPNDGVVRTLYMIMVGAGVSQPNWNATWHGLTVELLGQFEEQPLQAITLDNYWTQILYLRAYQDTATWSSSDLQAIDLAAGYGFGIHFDAQPNILRDCLLPPLASYCADIFTDAFGVARVRQLVDPKLATPVGAFDMTNTDRPIQQRQDRAQYLTTIAGGARNWAISGPADFVTDYALVPADVRMRYSRTSQYQVTSSITPAGEYSSAIGAPVFDTLIDVSRANGVADTTNLQKEIDRVVGLYAPRVYADGTIFNGKRNFVTFTLFFDDAGVLGDQTLGALTAPGLLIGDTVLLSYAHSNGVLIFDETPVFVAGTELFPFGNKLVVTGWY